MLITEKFRKEIESAIKDSIANNIPVENMTRYILTLIECYDPYQRESLTLEKLADEFHDLRESFTRVMVELVKIQSQREKILGRLEFEHNKTISEVNNTRETSNFKKNFDYSQK